MRARFIVSLFGIALVIVSAAGVTIAQKTPPQPAPQKPGVLGAGVTLLPNGWKIAPVGKHIQIGDLPLNMTFTADGKYLIVANSGYAKPTMRVVDLETEHVIQTLPLDDAWYGLAWSPNGRSLYAAGAAATNVVELQWAAGALKERGVFPLGRSADPAGEGTNRPQAAPQSFVGGVDVSPDGKKLYAVHVLGQLVTMVDVPTGLVRATAELPAEPFTNLVSKDGKTLYVSLWGGAKVLMFDPATLAPKGEIVVGEHPNAMTQSADGAWLYVACANTNAVWAIDTKAGKAVAQIATALFPEAPMGSTPNSVSLSPDGKTLLVANADNNTVAVVDVTSPAQARVSGFIPTGWYPTAAAFNKDGSKIYILSGKGLISGPNPRGTQPGDVRSDFGQYSGGMLTGSLTELATPTAADLEKYTKTVYSVTPYSDATRLAPASAPAVATSIPRKVGDASPIKHVFYIIRENRTYDQILGDIEKGNGDPTLTLFGENVTPNAHALAKEFVLFDNFYVDAEVSYDGHAYSTGAYATDIVEKFWPLNYAGRGAAYLSEGGGKMRNAYGNVAAPMNGYIWDAVTRAGKTVRSYGEFVARGFTPDQDRDSGVGSVHETVPGLKGKVHPQYPPFDLKIPDQRRADIFIEEFKKFDAAGTVPALSVVRLGGDHTNGTKAGSPTPTAMIADNDLALGRIVEAISQSQVWKDTAIFVLEDDAQNGPDHVDAHRSPVFVASPFAKRGAVDSTLYTTSGVLRTIEMILGLPPMSQYDASATPMYNAFGPTPTLTPFVKKDARVSLTEMNKVGAPGGLASAAMNFDDADMTPEIELNQILWMSVHGADAVMPPPVHAAFFRPVGNKPAATVITDDDDDIFDRLIKKATAPAKKK
jgi:YVTN family beta-propeller protein